MICLMFTLTKPFFSLFDDFVIPNCVFSNVAETSSIITLSKLSQCSITFDVDDESVMMWVIESLMDNSLMLIDTAP